MNWLLFLKLINGEYEIVQAGANIVPTEEFDKVIPTTEKIARQFEKVFFDGEKLRIKDNQTLSSLEDLNKILKAEEAEVAIPKKAAVFDIG
ncbi:hypothetical protein LDK94_06575 [Staphylococcus arlettae]|uniref:hypothetical protein n=1 Tax=Staphylococcus arlettae TaxID=29378 RepID=UPI001E355B94|nr:hypothetical protein [Staphylococcus arlettae]MCD9054999.1 hypothetical protein [Staphylococcus arlettae]